jgi:hypothetical protein
VRINLVFSPFGLPSLPLGISILKSYIEKQGVAHVTCYDFNMTWHNAFVQDIRRGDTAIDPELKEDFLKGFHLCREEDNTFFHQNAYDRYVIAFFHHMYGRYPHLNRQCKDALQNGAPVPAYVDVAVDRLLQNNPDMIGLSIMSKNQYYFSALIARAMKAKNRRIQTVFGGHFCCLTPPEFFLENTFIDYVVQNEGEKALSDLIQFLNGKKALSNIPNLVYRKGTAAAITRPAIIQELDKLPFPDFSDFDLNGYPNPYPVAPILTSRGCYWKRCTFCSHHSNYANTYRSAGIKRVVDELEHQHKTYGITHFNFVDEMISAARFRKMAEEILNRNLGINYYALAKPTRRFTPEILNAMYASGCRYIMWGVESGSQKILDLMDKGTRVADMGKVLKHSADAGIKNHLFIIIGFPSETKEDLKMTLAFLYENRRYIHQILRGTFSLYQGSMIFKNPEKFSISRIHPRPVMKRDMAINFEYDVSGGISADEAEALSAFYVEHYFRKFAYFSTAFGVLRDHALLVYAQADKIIFDDDRDTVPDPAELEFPSGVLIE